MLDCVAVIFLIVLMTQMFAEEVQCAVNVLERLQTWGCLRLVWGGDANVNLVDHGCDGGLIGDNILGVKHFRRFWSQKPLQGGDALWILSEKMNW